MMIKILFSNELLIKGHHDILKHVYWPAIILPLKPNYFVVLFSGMQIFLQPILSLFSFYSMKN